MPYTQRHWLLTIGGTLSGVEIWSFGLRLVGSDTSVAPTQVRVNEMEAPVRTWFTNTLSAFPNVHQVTLLKLAPIGVDGLYPPGEDSVERVPSPIIAGQSTAGTWPLQCAEVISLTTPLPRGRGHIGRVYLPPLHAGNIPTPYMPSGLPAQIGQTFRTLINDINALPGRNAFVKVMGKTGVGTEQTVTGLRIGRVIDTQRRRRNKLTEDYVSTTIP